MNTITLQSISTLSAGRPLFRAFGHVLAAGPGVVVAVPLSTVSGRLTDLVDGCPVPWDEVAVVLDVEAGDSVDIESPDFDRTVIKLVGAIARDGWRMAVLADLQALLFIHEESGARVAVAEALALPMIASRR